MKIVTPRLLISHLDLAMAYQIHLNSLDEDTRRFVPDEVFETEAEAQEAICYLISCYETQQGPLVYPVLLPDQNCIGYVEAIPLTQGEWEVGYHIAKAYTNHGYASEALQAFLPVIMQQLDLKEIYAIVLSENIASLKVLEHCGFTKIYQGPGLYQNQMREIIRYLWHK